MMPATLETAAPANFTLDRERNTIRFEHELAGSPAAAFAAWTEPEQVSTWWDPTGEPLASCAIDLRVGGSFAFTGRNHPDRPFSGTYREISPPHRLVFDAMGAEGRVSLAARGEGSLMIVEIVCSSPEQLEQFVAMGVAAGTSQTLDNLAAHLARSA
jgi:uncharacterized protein YndB with AHSA1/START domain